MVKPQILHMHRQPSARPPASVSYLFTGLAVAPLGVLLLMLNAVGINFKVRHDCPAERCAALSVRHTTSACTRSAPAACLAACVAAAGTAAYASCG